MNRNLKSIITIVGTAVFLSGCNTVMMKIPEFDSLKLPEFREEAENIGDYQDWASAPQAPTDLRPANEWDKSAQKIIKKRNGFVSPVGSEPSKTNTEIIRTMNALSDQVEEYKLDDPQ